MVSLSLHLSICRSLALSLTHTHTYTFPTCTLVSGCFVGCMLASFESSMRCTQNILHDNTLRSLLGGLIAGSAIVFIPKVRERESRRGCRESELRRKRGERAHTITQRSLLGGHGHRLHPKGSERERGKRLPRIIPKVDRGREGLARMRVSIICTTPMSRVPTCRTEFLVCESESLCMNGFAVCVGHANEHRPVCICQSCRNYWYVLSLTPHAHTDTVPPCSLTLTLSVLFFFSLTHTDGRKSPTQLFLH